MKLILPAAFPERAWLAGLHDFVRPAAKATYFFRQNVYVEFGFI